MMKNKGNKSIEKTVYNPKTGDAKEHKRVAEVDYEDVPDLPHPHEIITPTAEQKNQRIGKTEKQVSTVVPVNKKK